MVASVTSAHVVVTSRTAATRRSYTEPRARGALSRRRAALDPLGVAPTLLALRGGSARDGTFVLSDELISEIRERVDIVGLIGEFVRLQKRGNNHVGLCPFHSEKTPSFNVSANNKF